MLKATCLLAHCSILSNLLLYPGLGQGEVTVQLCQCRNIEIYLSFYQCLSVPAATNPLIPKPFNAPTAVLRLKLTVIPAFPYIKRLGKHRSVTAAPTTRMIPARFLNVPMLESVRSTKIAILLVLRLANTATAGRLSVCGCSGT